MAEPPYQYNANKGTSRSVQVQRYTRALHFIDTAKMDMSITNARKALENPTEELKQLLTDERVPQEAKEGLKEAGLDVESLTHSGKTEDKPSNGKSRSRVQVVDENQNFTYVRPPRSQRHRNTVILTLLCSSLGPCDMSE